MSYLKNKIKPLSKITCGQITRALRGVYDLKGRVYVVGGVVTEGETLRDIDVVLTNKADYPKIMKALGKYSKRAHILFQKKEPPANEFVVLTGKKPTSPDLPKKGEKIRKNEYVNSA